MKPLHAMFVDALLLGGLWVIACAPARAVELPRIFADGMVLQRDQPILIRGQAKAGEQVHARLNGRQASTRTGADGRWSLSLPAQAAGGPYQLEIDGAQEHHLIDDVLVGDVWLASGQSNMEWPIAQSADADAEIANATDPLIRHFKIPKSWSGEPQDQLAGGEWIAASPRTAANFSAVAHFFARELRKSTGVPIGIIDSTWGGSRIEAWMDASSQALDRAIVATHARELREADARTLAVSQRNLSRWPAAAADDRRWQATDLDDADWVAMPVPALWESSGWAGMDGIAWYRASFYLSEAEARAGASLGVGRIDDSDTTWVNGVQVGQTRMQYNQPRRYEIPAPVLQAGINHVAVRVDDAGGGGGIHGQADEVFIQPNGGAARSLPGWKFRPARVSLALVDDKNQDPALLYNAMIHPLPPYPLRGVIWYQGESNANTLADAANYRKQFPALIRQWRAQWNAPALPFLWVQLANFVSGVDHHGQSPWALLRESQSATLSLPATAQVVAIDIGNPADIHPLDKQDVGKRLALAARDVAYGEALVHQGPRFTAAHFEHGMGMLSFELDGSELAVRGGGDEVHGFQLAGPDRVFHPATASISGNQVVLHGDAVPLPIAVRYGWRDNPAEADLVNREQLPASPFRSDDW